MPSFVEQLLSNRNKSLCLRLKERKGFVFEPIKFSLFVRISSPHKLTWRHKRWTRGVNRNASGHLKRKLLLKCKRRESHPVHQDEYKTWTGVHGPPPCFQKEIASVNMKIYRRSGYEKHTGSYFFINIFVWHRVLFVFLIYQNLLQINNNRK